MTTPNNCCPYRHARSIGILHTRCVSFGKCWTVAEISYHISIPWDDSGGYFFFMMNAIQSSEICKCYGSVRIVSPILHSPKRKN